MRDVHIWAKAVEFALHIARAFRLDGSSAPLVHALMNARPMTSHRSLENSATSSSGVESVLARRTNPIRVANPIIVIRVRPEDHFCLAWPIETGLAYVVFWTGIGSITSVIRQLVISAIDEFPGCDFEQGIVSAFLEAFFQISELLHRVEMFLLQRHQLRVVHEQALLRVQELFIHRDDNLIEFAGITQCNCGLADVEGSFECTHCTGDQGDIHQSSPNVEKGGLGASDSTLRGNPVRGGHHG